MSQKQVMPKSEDLNRSLEINAIWTFDTEFPTIFNKSCTYITFKSAVKHLYVMLGSNFHIYYCLFQDKKIDKKHFPYLPTLQYIPVRSNHHPLFKYQNP